MFWRHILIKNSEKSKKRAVMGAAVVFMAQHRHRDIRFDVIAILIEKAEPEIFHIRDAFS